jgi:NADPH2:quinone reductase
MTIPSTMRAAQLSAYDGKPDSISVAEIPMPHVGPGKVLIKVHASPINPSDLMFVQGQYGFKKPLPAVPGFEGSGVVVESGSGMIARYLKGRRVACATADPGIASGTWAEYAVTSANLCVPLQDHVSLEQGATLLVNPMTAWAMLEMTRNGRHRALVQTAAASSLGRMVVRLGKRFSTPVISVVRRAEQVELLHDIGAEHVLDSSDPAFADRLRELCRQLGASIGFDAVAGELTAIVMRAQPRGSRMLLYGGLSLLPARADAASLIFEDKRLEGFWLSAWLRSKNMLSLLRLGNHVQALLAGDLKTEVHAKAPLGDAVAAMQKYAADMTAGKVLLMP